MNNTQTMEKVSVIIPTYNRSRLLEMTLRSLIFQSISSEFIQVIVVDDGSSDNTKEIVEKYQNELNLFYFFQEDKGYRVASARNLGIKHAQADLCIFIDSGIVVDQNFLHEHIQSYVSDSDRVAVLGPVYGFCNTISDLDDLIQVVIKFGDQNLGELFGFLHSSPVYKDVRDSIFKKYNYQIEKLPAPWVYYWTGNSSFRRSYLDLNEEPFDTIFDYNHGFEDCDLGYRLHKKGIKIKYNNNAKSFHYPHDKIENFEEMQRINLTKFHQKHNSLETQLLMDMLVQGIQDLDFHKYLFPLLEVSLEK